MQADRQGWKTLDWLLLLAYGAVAFSLLSVRPLWLDELMEVVGSAGRPLKDVITGYAAHSAGQSPLAACEQAMAMKLFGFSLFSVRLPAAISAVVAGAGMLALAWGRLAFALLVSFPLVLRYAAEDRPYSQVLCIAVLLSLVFTAYSGWRLYATYAVLLIVGLYTQPYIVFLAFSHSAYLIVRKQRRAAIRLSTVIAAAICAYLPWYFYARGFWRQEVAVSQLHFHPQLKLGLLILREMSGAGYAGTAILLALSVAGSLYSRKRNREWLLWVLSFWLPICFVVLADWLFDYFFAIRQVIFVLPALAVLAAAGLERLWEENGVRTAGAAAIVLFALNIGYAVRWFTKPGEDWQSAAHKLETYKTAGACILALPAGSGAYYTFFDPVLKGNECDASFSSARAVAVAISPYVADRESEDDVRRRLQRAGFVLQCSGAGQPRVQLYVRKSGQ
jgi:hypothetical protein